MKQIIKMGKVIVLIMCVLLLSNVSNSQTFNRLDLSTFDWIQRDFKDISVDSLMFVQTEKKKRSRETDCYEKLDLYTLFLTKNDSIYTLPVHANSCDVFTNKFFLQKLIIESETKVSFSFLKKEMKKEGVRKLKRVDKNTANGIAGFFVKEKVFLFHETLYGIISDNQLDESSNVSVNIKIIYEELKKTKRILKLVLNKGGYKKSLFFFYKDGVWTKFLISEFG